MNQTCEIKAVCEEIDQLLEKIKHEQQLAEGRLPEHIQDLYCQLEKSREVLAILKLRALEDQLKGEKWKQKQSIG
jgi:hypothetical protein